MLDDKAVDSTLASAAKKRAKSNGEVDLPSGEASVGLAAKTGEAAVAGEASRATYYAGVFPGPDHPLPLALGEAAFAIGAAFETPVWLLLQNHPTDNPFASMTDSVADGFFRFRADLAECERVAVIVDSPGGYGPPAYRLSRLFQRHCGGWSAIVPRYAKSAATLFIMGADQLYMGRDAELGPLDAQLMDREREEVTSALDEVQALERLHSSAMDQIDQSMQLLLARTGKKVETLLPIVTKFVSDSMAPLLDKIDTVHYSQQSRVLKVAEDYAVRLLTPRVSRPEAEQIARHFVNHYSEHGFVIDADEANFYLDIANAGGVEKAAAIATLEEWLTENQTIALGPLQVVTEETDHAGSD